MCIRDSNNPPASFPQPLRRYLVKWRHYSSSQNTWESEASILNQYAHLVRELETGSKAEVSKEQRDDDAHDKAKTKRRVSKAPASAAKKPLGDVNRHEVIWPVPAKSRNQRENSARA
eukprot:3029165-Rhodomonas_salina.1